MHFSKPVRDCWVSPRREPDKSRVPDEMSLGEQSASLPSDQTVDQRKLGLASSTKNPRVRHLVFADHVQNPPTFDKVDAVLLGRTQERIPEVRQRRPQSASRGCSGHTNRPS